MRKVFLDGLPRWGNNINNGGINWKKSVGYKIPFIYDDIEGIIEIINYHNGRTPKIDIKYSNLPIYTMNTSHLCRCQLKAFLRIKSKDFKIEIGTHIKDNKRDLIITDRKYIKCNDDRFYKHYKYICNKCGFECGEHYKSGEYKEEHLMRESDLSKGEGCTCCSISSKIVVEGINDIPTTAPWMIPYFQGGYDEAKMYTKRSSKRIYSICPDCGRIKDKKTSIDNIYKNHSIGCICGDGKKYPEKFMFNMLEQLGIDFETEYSPEWIKPKRYDFYFKLKNIEYIIEMDGGQHKNKYSRSSNWNPLEKQQKDDNYKDKLAEEHNIKVIRIDCEFSELEFIKNNILDSTLNEIFDLSNIDWEKCEEFALSNLCKKACEIKRDNSDMTTTEIGLQLNLDRQTIRKYLKKGSRVWNWCNYNAKEESIKIGKENGKSTAKPIEVFKDGISLGIFPSCSELERQSENLFGVKLNAPQISRVCNGIKIKYKHFYFKYI